MSIESAGESARKQAQPELKKQRKELERYIPADFAVKFPNCDFSRMNDDSAKLFEELNERLKNPTAEDEMLWAKIIEFNKKEFSGEAISSDEEVMLSNLEKESEKEKKELAEMMTLRNEVNTELSWRIRRDEWDIATKLAVNLIRSGDLKKGEDFFETVIGHDLKFAKVIAFELTANGGSKIIKRTVDQYISIGDFDTAGFFVATLIEQGEADLAKEILEKTMASGNTSRSGPLMGEIGAAGETEFVREKINGLIEKGNWELVNYYINQLAKAGEKVVTKEVANKMIDKGAIGDTARLVAELIENGEKDFLIKKMIEDSLGRGDWGAVRSLAVAAVEDGQRLMIEELKEQNPSVYGLGVLNDALLNHQSKQEIREELEKKVTASDVNSIHTRVFTDSLDKLFELGEKDLPAQIVLDVLIENGYETQAAVLVSQMLENGYEVNVAETIERLKHTSATYKHSVELKSSRMIEIGKKTFSKSENILNEFEKKGAEFAPFGAGLITSSLELGRPLKESYQSAQQDFNTLNEFSKKENETQSENKKVKNPDEWWKSHGQEVGTLYGVGRKRSIELMKNLMAQGLPKTEAFLQLFKTVDRNPDVLSGIDNAVEADGKNQMGGLGMMALIETGAGFASIGESAEFEAGIEKYLQKRPADFQYTELQDLLSRGMLLKLSEQLKISSEKIESQDLGRWDLQKLPNLLSNAKMLENAGNHEQINLYKSILKSCFEDNFAGFISNTEQDDKVGRDVAEHNKKVNEDLESLGVDTEAWDGFSEALSFDLVSEKGKKDPVAETLSLTKERLNKLLEQLGVDLENKRSQALAGALKKDLAELDKGKKDLSKRLQDFQDPSELLSALLANYQNTFKSIRSRQKEGESVFELSPEQNESLQHLNESLGMMYETKNAPITSNLVKETLTVKKWDRDPRKDFFQGNHTHCCIAVGVKEAPAGGGLTTHHPETIQQYLTDKGINVVEVVDQEGKPVAQTWVFISEQAGKPVMVLDNIEVNNKYGVGRPGNNLIREQLFAYLKLYAQRCGIDKIVLGDVSTNDVVIESPKKEPMTVNKVGGYLYDEPYYLEALPGKANISEEVIVIADKLDIRN